MNLEERVSVLVELGKEITIFLNHPKGHKWYDALQQAYILNHWFTEESVLKSFNGITSFLEEENLKQWLAKYNLPAENNSPKKVGVIMAGNLPIVGFHDLLCVFASGNKFTGKLSSDDRILLPTLVAEMVVKDSRVAEYICFNEQLKENIDTVIATGNNNSARYFEYYFGKYEHIIRKNRNAVAVLSGEETTEELEALGNDIFSYFGLGCRNVSKLFLPKGYNIDLFYKGIYKYKNCLEHNKYNNNYSYNRTVFLMQSVKFYDNNFLLLKEEKSYSSPIGALHFEVYDDKQQLKSLLEKEEKNIQCVVSSIKNLHKRQVAFGKAQHPQLDDYADGVDTLAFLMQ